MLSQPDLPKIDQSNNYGSWQKDSLKIHFTVFYLPIFISQRWKEERTKLVKNGRVELQMEVMRIQAHALFDNIISLIVEETARGVFNVMAFKYSE